MHSINPAMNMTRQLPSLEDVLLQYWGYPTFRPLQREIIGNAIAQRDCLALLPTGGGKSICYQVPALVSDGICIVISPLIALMRDQVQQLKDRGIDAEAIYSGMHASDVDRILDNCIYGKTKLLYLSPERLTTDLARERIMRMRVSLIAVDEAHCISQWGHDFRPAYRDISVLREWHPGVPILALTASATAPVRADIVSALELHNPQVITGSFRRANLSYLVYPREDKWQRMLEILGKLPGSKLVYTRSRSKAAQLSKLIAKHGIRCEAYHAGMTSKQRNHVQQRWIDGETPIVVCTTAFGMGIDKPDVRAVLHFDLPGSMEEYYQEAGRAGRDGKRAFCVLLYDQSDLPALQERCARAFPEMADITHVYRALCGHFTIAIGHGAGDAYTFDFRGFLKKYSLDAVQTYHCLEGLERDGWIALSESVIHPSTVQVTEESDVLYEYQSQNAEAGTVLRTMLRNYEGLFLAPVRIRETEIAKLAGVKESQVIEQLTILARDGVIDYSPSSELPRITFLRERVEDRNLTIDVGRLAMLRDQAITRANRVGEYISNHNCRERYILEYFGEQTSSDCGSCDLCRSKHAAISHDTVLLRIPESGITLKELMACFSATYHKDVREILKSLEDDELIVFDHDAIRLVK